MRKGDGCSSRQSAWAEPDGDHPGRGAQDQGVYHRLCRASSTWAISLNSSRPARGFDAYFGIPFSNDMGQTTDKGRTQLKRPHTLLRNEQAIETEPDQHQLTRRYR